MENGRGALRGACVGIAYAFMASGAAFADPPAVPVAPQSTLEQLIKKLEQQDQILAQQQRRLAEQENKLKEYQAALERSLAEQKLRLRDLEAQRGTGNKGTGETVGSDKPAVDRAAQESDEAKEKRTKRPSLAQAKSPDPQDPPPQPAGRPPESANRPPEIAPIADYPGVLTPRGKFVLEPALEFAHSSNDRVSVFGLTILPAIAIGLIDIRSVNRDLFIASLATRYGLTDRLEFEVKVPYVYRQDSTTARPLTQAATDDQVFNVNGNGLGDVELTGRYQLNRGGTDTPFYVGSLRFKTTTGTGPFDVPTNSPLPGLALPTQLATGTGFYALQPGITALFASDPVVFFGGASYAWNIKRNIERVDSQGNPIGEYDPGDDLTLNFGMGLSLNERASFSVGYQHDVLFKDKHNGVPVVNAQIQHLGQLLIGYSYQLSKTTNFSLSLNIGVTDPAPDVTLTVRLPITF